MEKIRDRLKILRKIKGMNQKEFGDALKTPQRTIAYWEQSDNLASRNIQLICATFNVREEWLLHGEGEIFLDPEPIPASDLIDRLQSELKLTETVTRLLRRFAELEEPDQKKVLEAVDLMLGEKKEEKASKSQKKTTDNPENLRKLA